MKAFLIPLTVATSEARIYVNPDHIVFIREVNNGTQLVTTVINEGAVMPIVKEKPEEVYLLCRLARTEEEAEP
ncbi:MAG TPA: hypothetical protein VKV03_19525 [Candidatus Binataceae bacterium]|nr:hypothetical protein [Candidatus Binataceae bacterium]